MKQYLAQLQEILDNWIEKMDRTWTWVKGIFGMQAKYDLQDWFPLVTTKKTFLRIIIVELIWLIRGETNIKYLVDRNCHIWDEWPFQNWLDNSGEVDKKDYPMYSEKWYELKKEFAEKIKNKDANDPWVKKWGELGPVYWHQWRNFNWPHNNSPQAPLLNNRGDIKRVDQIKNAIDQIKNNPTNRRIIVSAWNPAQIDEMLLPPCHAFFQFNVDTTNNKLNLQLYQRSADMFLWVPFNIASYSTMLLLFSKITWLTPWTFTHTLWDAHIYSNHFDQVKEQLSREPFPLPELKLKKDIKTLEDIEALEWEDFELVNYKSHGVLKAPVAV